MAFLAVSLEAVRMIRFVNFLKSEKEISSLCLVTIFLLQAAVILAWSLDVRWVKEQANKMLLEGRC